MTAVNSKAPPPPNAIPIEVLAEDLQKDLPDVMHQATTELLEGVTKYKFCRKCKVSMELTLTRLYADKEGKQTEKPGPFDQIVIMYLCPKCQAHKHPDHLKEIGKKLSQLLNFWHVNLQQRMDELKSDKNESSKCADSKQVSESPT